MKERLKEPRPPDCVCCEYMRVCNSDRDNGQKIDYCPDPEYRRWLFDSEPVKEGKDESNTYRDRPCQ